MIKVKQLPRRQCYRKALLLLSLLLFPVMLYYFSPMLILDGAAQGVINGSFIISATACASLLASRTRAMAVAQRQTPCHSGLKGS